MGGKIAELERGSIAEAAGLAKGDEIISINSKPVNDILDFIFFSSSDSLNLEYMTNGERKTMKIEKEEEEPLGITFENIIFDKIKVCRNKCDFCFVDQDPRDVRKTMQIKDDDYRLSFLSGNFITLTNLNEKDWQKIEEMKLSPLYVSVHSTEPDIRRGLMNNQKAEKILEYIERLVSMRINIHAQIVLCPGINDGKRLEKTLADLGQFYPSVESIAVVPVGLTKYRQPNGIRSFTREEMLSTIKTVSKISKEYMKKYGDSFAYLADEFFIKTDLPIPPAKYYGSFPQLENGIGLTRLFLTEAARGKRYIPSKIAKKRQVGVITGKLAYKTMTNVVELFSQVENLEIKLHMAKSVFWGDSVDVCGLLTGMDIIEAIKQSDSFSEVIIPGICLKEGNIFLDGMTLEEVMKITNRNIIPTDGSFKSFRNAVLGTK